MKNPTTTAQLLNALMEESALTSHACRFYTDVPPCCIARISKSCGGGFYHKNQVPNEYTEDTIDILACIDEQVIFAYVLEEPDEDYDEWEAPKGPDMCGIPHIFINHQVYANGLLPDEALRSYRRHLRSGLDSIYSTMDTQSHRLPTHSLSDFENICAKKLPAAQISLSTASLQQLNMLNSDGEITAYGRFCGLLSCYHRDARAMPQHSYVVADYLAERFTEQVVTPLLPLPKKNKISPLQEQLQNLEDDQLMSSSSCNRVIQQVQQLLETPVDDLCRNRQIFDYRPMRNAIRQGGNLLNEKVDSVVSYGDCIRLVHRLWSPYSYCSNLSDERCRKSYEASRDILNFLLSCFREQTADPCTKSTICSKPRPLAVRLSDTHAGKKPSLPIADMPLRHYAYAAARLSGSSYPMWFYQHQIMDGWLDAAEDNDLYTLRYIAAFLDNSRREQPLSEERLLFPLTYNLLVAFLCG